MTPGRTTRRLSARTWLGLSMLACAVLAGCGTSRQPSGSGGSPGGYGVGGGDYRRDGPHANPPANLDKVPDAVPRIEPFSTGPMRPYVVNGKRYVPDTTDQPYRVVGKASWYGRQFHGRPTSNGEIYDMYAMTAAHPTLPIPSYARVTRTDTGKSVIVRINDRGPFHSERVIDLSYVAAYKLGTLANGTGEVMVERITHAEIRRGNWPTAPAMLASAPAPTPVAAPAPVPAPAAVASWDAAASPGASATPRAGVISPSTAPASSLAAAGGGGFATTPAAPQDWASVLAIPVPAAPPPAPVRAVASLPATAPAPQPAVSPAAFAVGQAFLQLGAFGEAQNAQSLADRIRGSVSSMGAIQVVRTDNVYRVRLGPFADRNTAVAHADTVYGQTGIRPHVVTQ